MMLGNDDSLGHASRHKGRRRLVVRRIPLMLTRSGMEVLRGVRCLLRETAALSNNALKEEGIWIVVRSYVAL